MIALTPDLERQILADAKKAVVDRLVTGVEEELKLLEAVEVSALLKLDPRTWMKLIPSVSLAPGIRRWLRADVAKFIQDRREKP